MEMFCSLLRLAPKKTIACVVLVGAAACSEPEPTPSSTPSSAPSSPVAATVPSPPIVPIAVPTPTQPVVGPKLTAPPPGVPQALFDVAAKHNDEPGDEELTARLRKRAVELRTACEKLAEKGGACENAWYLSCEAGEAEEFWLSGFEGTTAIYSAARYEGPIKEFFRINFVDEGGWKVDAKSCNGPDHFQEPWAKQQKPKQQY